MVRASDTKETTVNDSKASNNPVITNIFKNKNNSIKTSDFPPSTQISLDHCLKRSSSGNFPKEKLKLNCNQVKSLSPVLQEPQIIKKHFQNKSNLNLKISKLDKSNYFPLPIHSGLERKILTRLETLEKNDLSEENVIKEYLRIFEEFIDSINQYKEILQKFKVIFSDLFYKNIELTNNIQKMTKKAKQSSLDIKNEIKKGNISLIDSCIIPKGFDDTRVNKINGQHKKTLKSSKQKQKPNLENTVIVNIPGKSIENVNKNKLKITERIPKLSLKENIKNTKEFHEEFISNIQEFSLSWRNLIEIEKKY
jgi:hypothetical protein